MTMKKGDIVTVVTISGEYVGKLLAISDDGNASVEMENPRMILQNPQDGTMGFAKGIAATGEESPTHVIFNQYVFMTPSSKKVVDAHLQATTGITLVK